MKCTTALAELSYSQVALIYLYPFRCNSLLKSMRKPQIAKKH